MVDIRWHDGRLGFRQQYGCLVSVAPRRWNEAFWVRSELKIPHLDDVPTRVLQRDRLLAAGHQINNSSDALGDIVVAEGIREPQLTESKGLRSTKGLPGRGHHLNLAQDESGEFSRGNRTKNRSLS